MAERVVVTGNGAAITVSSPDLTDYDLALAEILLEIAVEQGSPQASCSFEELARRMAKKGYSAETGERLH